MLLDTVLRNHATMAMTVGGPPVRVTAWQERELGMAASKKLVTLYHGSSPRTIGFGASRRLYLYRELQDAFATIEKAIADPTGEYWGGMTLNTAKTGLPR